MKKQVDIEIPINIAAINNKYKSKILTVILTMLLLLSLSVICFFRVYSYNTLSVTVQVNDIEYAVGNVKCRQIPEIDGCQQYDYNGISYKAKKYSCPANLDASLHLCDTYIESIKDGIEIVIWNNEYLQLSYSLSYPVSNTSWDSSGIGNSSLMVWAYEYITNMSSLNESLLKFEDNEFSYKISNSPDKTDSSKMTEVHSTEKYIINENNTTDDTLCIECITTIDNIRSSSYYIIFIKDDILYAVYGKDIDVIKNMINYF